MTQQLLPFPDRSREIYACDIVWGYFPLTQILQHSGAKILTATEKEMVLIFVSSRMSLDEIATHMEFGISKVLKRIKDEAIFVPKRHSELSYSLSIPRQD